MIAMQTNPATTPDLPFRAAIRGIDALSLMLLVAGVAGILAIMGIMIFEVVSRNFFDAPTRWSVEIVTYLVVATAFLPLAQLQREGGHIRVEIIADAARPGLRRGLDGFGRHFGLFLVGMMTWQYALYVIKDYQAGSRDWGLMQTPLWIPELPVFIGLAGLTLAILADMLRHRTPGCTPLRLWLAIAAIVVAGAVLASLGLRPALILGRELDIGTLVVLATVTAVTLLLSGLSAALWFAIVAIAFAGTAYVLAGVGFVAVGVFIAVAILIFLLTGMPISVAIGFVALLGLYFLLPLPQLSLLADRPWRALNSYTYSAIPMFILMGSILIRSGVSGSFFGAIAAWLGRIPGGLAHAALGASGMFAAVSGSSIATAATIGQVSAPEMIKRGYSKKLALGAIAGGGTLGILIPPSIPMIVYGATVGAPVTDLFAAALVPGLMVLASMMALVLVWALIDRKAAPRSAPVPSGTALASLRHILPFLLLIAAVIGSIYTGFVTPTEAGALGAAAAVLLSAAYGRLSVRMIREAGAEAAKLSAAIMFIVVATSILTWVMDYARIPQSIVATVEALNLAPALLLLAIAVFYIILGMFIDPISMLLMTIAITLPIVELAGYDKIWFGVALVIMIEVGLITPPVGMILFVIRGIVPQIPLKEVVLGAVPFVAVILLNVVLIAVFPGIVAFLPGLIAQ